jgi:hypothetical protein
MLAFPVGSICDNSELMSHDYSIKGSRSFCY